jgi:hypothetical protein
MEQVCKQLCDISQFVGFQSMNRRILFLKGFHKGISPSIIDQTEPSTNESIVPKKGTFLGATFNQHIDELAFATLRNVNLGQLMHALLKTGTGHDGKINGATQMDQISLRQVLNDNCLGLGGNHGELLIGNKRRFFFLFFRFFFFATFICGTFTTAILLFIKTQDFGSNLAPVPFLLIIILVKLKDIELIFSGNIFAIQTQFKSNLIIPFHQIQFFGNGRQ